MEFLEHIDRGKPSKFILGFQASGVFHLGHYQSFYFLKRFKQINPEVQIVLLLSDIHARLNFKEKVDEKTESGLKFLKKFMPQATIVTSSQLIKDPRYWQLFLQFSLKINLNGLLRALPMQRKKETMQSKLLTPGSFFCYSMMQCIDSHYLGANAVLAGSDQRNIYMESFDTYDKLGWPKPSAFFIPLLNMQGQLGTGVKMSSSGRNLALDKNLYELVCNTIQGKNTFLITLISDSLLQLHQTDRSSYLNHLLKDLQPLKDFTFES